MAVAFDAVGPAGGAGTGGSGTPITWTHVDGASATAIFAGLTNFGSADSITAVTYNSVSLASQGHQDSNNIASGGGVTAFLLTTNPATGSNTVSATHTGSNNVNAGSVSFTGSGSAGTPVKAFAGGATSVSVSVPSTTTGGMIALTACFGSSATFSGTNGVTVRWSHNNSGLSGADNGVGGTVTSTGGGAAQTVGFSNTATDDWGLVAVELLPGGGATAGPPVSLWAVNRPALVVSNSGWRGAGHSR